MIPEIWRLFFSNFFLKKLTLQLLKSGWHARSKIFDEGRIGSDFDRYGKSSTDKSEWSPWRKLFKKLKNCKPRAERAAWRILVSLQLRAKRETKEILLNLPLRAERVAYRILVNLPLDFFTRYVKTKILIILENQLRFFILNIENQRGGSFFC